MVTKSIDIIMKRGLITLRKKGHLFHTKIRPMAGVLIMAKIPRQKNISIPAVFMMKKRGHLQDLYLGSYAVYNLLLDSSLFNKNKNKFFLMKIN